MHTVPVATTTKFSESYILGRSLIYHQFEMCFVAISNVKITEEGEDIRSMILKGGFSTTKILFDRGSDKLNSSPHRPLDFLIKLEKPLRVILTYKLLCRAY